jgi:hypothetical protein
MKQDEAAHPLHVNFLGAAAVVSGTENFPRAVKQFGLPTGDEFGNYQLMWLFAFSQSSGSDIRFFSPIPLQL